MSEQPRRRRDPEARRASIIAAAAELIIEVGVDAITHRMVAARADVPLGATTQYFDTLDDLREAALERLVGHVDAQMQSIRSVLDEKGVSAKTLAGLLSASLADAPALRADRAVVTAAVHDPRLRALARTWSVQLRSILEPVYGAERAAAAGIFIDGVIWNSHIDDESLTPHLIENALAGILGDTRTP